MIKFNMDNKDLIVSLLRCEVVRLGNFKLKSGEFSPIYIDLRRIIHYPSVVKDLAVAVRAKQTALYLNIDTVCGVPYTALPIASVFSVLYDVPMIMKRKESKSYGTGNLLEGNFSVGHSCLIIEDIVSSGTSIIETTQALRDEGLIVQDCIVIVNRNQGGLENALKVGVTVHPLLDVNSVISVYSTINKVETELLENVSTYFRENSNVPVFQPESDSFLTFEERANITNHPVAKRLFNIIVNKKSNLCAAVDSGHSNELLFFAEQLGPHICLLKTHVDILCDFSEKVTASLQKIAIKHNFLIMEDRKFADIGNTVKQQYLNGMYKIKEWADLVTVHGIAGSDMIEAMKSENRACVLVAEMSSEGALTNNDYKQSVFKIAERYPDFIIGYVAQHRNNKKKNLIHMCPGVNLESSRDALGQQYKLPEEAVAHGADIVIVGRGISRAGDVVASAIKYKTRSFNAYLQRVS